MTAQPLNLTTRRGPSIWTRLEQDAATDRQWLQLVMAAAFFSIAALRRSSRRGRWVALGGVLGVGAALVFRRHAEGARVPKWDEPLDDALADSFPASDPPSSVDPAWRN